MDKVKLVAFDLEGVLFDWRGGLHAISSKTGINNNKIRSYILNNLLDLESGKLDSIVFWKNFCINFNINQDPQEIFKDWILNQEKLKSNWEIAKKLKANNYKIALCSNSWSGLIKIFVENYPEFSIFDYIFDSSRLGFVKPEVEYFDFVEKETGFHGEEILLVDDSENNRNGARNFGWQVKNENFI